MWSHFTDKKLNNYIISQFKRKQYLTKQIIIIQMYQVEISLGRDKKTCFYQVLSSFSTWQHRVWITNLTFKSMYFTILRTEKLYFFTQLARFSRSEACIFIPFNDELLKIQLVTFALWKTSSCSNKKTKSKLFFLQVWSIFSLTFLDSFSIFEK